MKLHINKATCSDATLVQEYDTRYYTSESSEASEEAKKKGLHHVGFGKYADGKGNITFMSVHGKLHPLEHAKHIKKTSVAVRKLIKHRKKTGDDIQEQLTTLLKGIKDPYHRAKIATETNMLWKHNGSKAYKKQVKQAEDDFVATMQAIDAIKAKYKKAMQTSPDHKEALERVMLAKIKRLKEAYKKRAITTFA